MEAGTANEVRDFWQWFRVNADAISLDVENADLLSELDRRVAVLDERISWEIGPGSLKRWQLAISPNLDRDLRELTRAIVAWAPDLEGWEFYSAKQSKDWNYQVDILDEQTSGMRSIDASRWRFVLLKYADGFQEILIESPDLVGLDDDDQTRAGEIVLTSLLGEDLFLDSIDSFELLDQMEPRFADEARPLQQLVSAITGRER